jgi:transcription initiation factor IIE alpha subunit
MQKYICKLCTVESSFDEQTVTPFHIEHGVCEMCMNDIYTSLQSSHLLKNEELSLKINLRKLRNSLSKINSQWDIVNTIERLDENINEIEWRLKKLDGNYPSVVETISEYHSLVRVYR